MFQLNYLFIVNNHASFFVDQEFMLLSSRIFEIALVSLFLFRISLSIELMLKGQMPAVRKTDSTWRVVIKPIGRESNFGNSTFVIRCPSCVKCQSKTIFFHSVFRGRNIPTLSGWGTWVALGYNGITSINY